jgi:hypothetical protein
MGDAEIAIGIRNREQQLKIWDTGIPHYAGPDCFARKPNYRSGGQGISTAEEFRNYGINLIPGDPDRAQKMRAFRQRLLRPLDAEGKEITETVSMSGSSQRVLPMLVVYRHCRHFIRTIPNLIISPHNPEDVDTDGEDHVYDEAALACMSRPMKVQKGFGPMSEVAQTWARIEGNEQALEEHQAWLEEQLPGQMSYQ